MEKDNQKYFAVGVVSIAWIFIATILIFSETKGDRAFGVAMFLVALGALTCLCFGMPQKTGILFRVDVHTEHGTETMLIKEISPYASGSMVDICQDGMLSFDVDRAYAPDLMWILAGEPVSYVSFKDPFAGTKSEH